MPKVTLRWSDGSEYTATGGCFGFVGRNTLSGHLDPQGSHARGGHEITNFKYILSHAWRLNPNWAQGLTDPRPILRWMARQSMWAKYVNELHLPGGEFTRGDSMTWVDIKTDIPGHFVVGTASAFRFPIDYALTLLPFWNTAVKFGCDPMITFLVYYAMCHNTSELAILTNHPNEDMVPVGERNLLMQLRVPRQGHSTLMNMSDNEVMRLNDIDPETVYEMIEGTAEFIHDDFNPHENYATSHHYTQDILNSYARANKVDSKAPITYNFADFIIDRFYKHLAFPELQRRSGGLGSSNGLNLSRDYPMSRSFLLGVAGQLSHEYRAYGKFLGWRSEQ